MDLLNNILGSSYGKIRSVPHGGAGYHNFFYFTSALRIAGIRTLGRQSAFDTLASLMLGAIMGRVVVANQSFFGSILAALVLMLHRLMAWLAFHNKRAGGIIKGKSLLLMKDGKKQLKNLSNQNYLISRI